MESLEYLKREKQRLLNRREARKEIEQIGQKREALKRENLEEIRSIGRKRKSLKKEIKELKSPRRTAIKKGIVKALRESGESTSNYVKSLNSKRTRRSIKRVSKSTMVLGNKINTGRLIGSRTRRTKIEKSRVKPVIPKRKRKTFKIVFGGKRYPKKRRKVRRIPSYLDFPNPL